MTDLIKRHDALTVDDAIHALPTVDPAAIREAALREAAIACQSVLVDAKSYNMPQQAIGAAQCRESILALIGGKK